MNADPISLIITTPLQVVVKADRVRSFRASDDSGGFGLMPGHVDLLTVLTSCVARWREADKGWQYCALRGGVMTLSGGQDLRIACREAIVGDDLALLESKIQAERDQAEQNASSFRIAQAKMHAKAIRRIMAHLADHRRAEAVDIANGMFDE